MRSELTPQLTPLLTHNRLKAHRQASGIPVRTPRLRRECQRMGKPPPVNMSSWNKTIALSGGVELKPGDLFCHRSVSCSAETLDFRQENGLDQSIHLPLQASQPWPRFHPAKSSSSITGGRTSGKG